MSESQPATAVLSGSAEEAFRGLWASVFSHPLAPKAVVVCTPNRVEGATTVACGLALAGAGQGDQARVALVDLNLRTPRVDRQLRLKDGTGVSDVLVGGVDLDAALQRVGPGQLDVLTAGGQCGRLSEILQTGRVGGLLAQLKDRYDQVVIDTAPVNRYPDAQVVARAADGIVLVARYRHTPRESLLQAKRRLEAGSDGKILGTVLNMRTYPIPGFVYRRV